MERRNQLVRDERMRRAMEEIATRIRPLCGGMPDPEFRLLVERMAIVHLKYTLRRSIVLPYQE